MVIEPSYTGPKLENGVDDVNSDWVVELMGHLKEGKVLHKKYASLIILKCRDLFEKDQSLVNITVPDDKEVTVCGDIHG
jgi:serine/threonine-protein phosphatase 5